MIIKKEEYIETVRRPYPPFWSSLILVGSSNETHYKSFLRKPYARRNTIVLDYIWYYWRISEDEARCLIAKEWINKKRLSQIIRLFKKREQELLNATKEDIKNLCSKYEAYMPALGLTYLAETPFYEQTKKLLREKLPSAKVEELLTRLNIPLQDNFYKKEEYDLVIAKNIKKHVKKYEWIFSRYGSDTPYTEKEAREKLLEIDRHIFLKKYNAEKQTIKKAITRAKKIVGKAKEYLIDGLQFILFYRTHRTDIMNKVAYLYIPFLKNIALKYELSYDELLMCTKDEVVNGEIPSKALLADRMNSHAMIVDQNKVRCLVRKERKALSQIFKERVKKVEIIKGNVASKGIERGVVKIIFRRNDFLKMSDGDILVASMTTPEMVPVMKKAAAFITDEGGITCHAAIVAREMGKPCIIGTKIATKVLKDGDLVEVDANKGIVKILAGKK